MSSGPSRGASAFVRRYFLARPWFWLTMLPLFALDLWSKAAVYEFLRSQYDFQPPPRESVWRYEVWEGPIDFSLVWWKNPGTIWGLFQGYPVPLMVLRTASIFAIVYFVGRLPRRSRVWQIVLALVMAGAAGNLYDNFTQPDHAVRDFLLFSAEIGGELYRFPAFNVADSCICVGAFTLAILLLRNAPGSEALSSFGPVSDDIDSGNSHPGK